MSLHSKCTSCVLDCMQMNPKTSSDSDGSTRWVFEPAGLCLSITGAILFVWSNVLMIIFGIAICHKWTGYMSNFGMTNVLVILFGIGMLGVLLFGVSEMRKKTVSVEEEQDVDIVI